MIKTRKTIFGWVLFFLILCSGLYLFRDPLLVDMGRYLAPAEATEADAVIVEGSATVETVAVNQAIAWLKAGKAKKIILVVHRLPPGEDIFALPKVYSQMIAESLMQKGLTSAEIDVMDVPVTDPVTLSEATYVLERQSKKDVRKVVLMAEGFHMRRSLLAYRHVGKSLNIKVSPSPYYAGYQPEAWWLTADGCRDYFSETIKLLYYVLRGHIPLRSIFTLNI